MAILQQRRGTGTPHALCTLREFRMNPKSVATGPSDTSDPTYQLE